MQFVRRLIRQFSNLLTSPLVTAGRFLLAVIGSLKPEAALFSIALALITIAVWRTIGPELACLLLGLLILRDLERPPSAPPKP